MNLTVFLVVVCCALLVSSTLASEEDHCDYYRWTSWSKCSNKCGGVQKRIREPRGDCSVLRDQRRCRPSTTCNSKVKPKSDSNSNSNSNSNNYSNSNSNSNSSSNLNSNSNSDSNSTSNSYSNLNSNSTSNVTSNSSSDSQSYKDTETNQQAFVESPPGSPSVPPTIIPSNIFGLPTLTAVFVALGVFAITAVFIIAIVLYRRVGTAHKPKRKTPKEERSYVESDGDSYDTEPNTPELNFPAKQSLLRGSRGIVVGKEGKTFAYTVEELHSLQL